MTKIPTSKVAALLLAALFGVLATSCNNEEEDITPSIEWILDYSVTSVGDVTIDRIIYIDESRTEQVISGEREWRLSFNAESGFLARLIVEGTATAGGTIVRIEGTALDGSLRMVSNADDDGEASGVPRDIRLEVQLRLP